MYIKLKDYKNYLNKGDILLMSLEEFNNGGKEFKGVPIAVTLNGEEPNEEGAENEG